eukprot:SAG22_NODE_1830_length_3484_cov_1.448744_2_plen_596_part_00
MVAGTGAAPEASEARKPASEAEVEAEPISKDEALKRFLARKEKEKDKADSAAPSVAGSAESQSPPGKRKDDQMQSQRPGEGSGGGEEAQRREPREHKKLKQEHHGSYPASRKSHFALVPGNENTTTKEPMRRPPDLRLVTAMASKGSTLEETLTAMNVGPSGRDSMLQTLTTRDVVMIPDLFEASSGFVMPPDPWDKGDGTTKTIYQRLVEEIHQAGSHEARGGKGGGKGGKGGKGKFEDKCFSTDKDGLFKDDANGLFKAWHKTTPQAAGDGLASGRDGNGHLIVNDKDDRWRQAQQRGEAPMYTAVHERIEQYFKMKIQGKRYNHYRDMTNWKPFHHDAAGLDKSAGKGKGKGKGGGGGGRPPMCETQNMTVGVSFGESRQAGFEWAASRGRCSGGGSFPGHLLSPPVQPGSHSNVVLSLTLPDSSTYTFGRDVNLLWKHGILAEKPPAGTRGGGAELNVEEGRISIIAWGWVDQYDELDEYLEGGQGGGAAAQRGGGGGGGGGSRGGRGYDDRRDDRRHDDRRQDDRRQDGRRQDDRRHDDRRHDDRWQDDRRQDGRRQDDRRHDDRRHDDRRQDNRQDNRRDDDRRDDRRW